MTAKLLAFSNIFFRFFTPRCRMILLKQKHCLLLTDVSIESQNVLLYFRKGWIFRNKKYDSYKCFELHWVMWRFNFPCGRTRQAIRYRVVTTLRQSQIQQCTASNEGATKPTRTSFNFDKVWRVHLMAVTENYYSLGMLTILTTIQIVSILSTIFAGKFTHIKT